MQEATLALPLRGNPATEVLLGYKKSGFGQGKYTGFGGKIEPGETIRVAAARELAEETGIIIPKSELVPVAVMTFKFPAFPAWSQRVHLFITTSFYGKAVETYEMIPRWFRTKEIPYALMWDDGRYWLPRILAGDKFNALFRFKLDNATVDSFEISEWHSP